MQKIILFCFFGIMAGFATTACTSTPTLRQGVQPEAVALNPARIAAFPMLLIPHPSEQSSLDPGALSSGEIITAIESKILSAFKNQPGVNGIGFQSVRSSLKTTPGLSANIEGEMRSMGQLANSGSARETLLLSGECRSRKSFLDFYKHCLLKSQRWVPLLNQFSLVVQNSDSMLLPILTSLEKFTNKDTYSVRFGVALLLVDTNSGRLIWGRDSSVLVESPAGVKQFPDLKTAYDKIFTESFWAEFPGRRSKPEATKQ
ncbi:MAG: hypothetical protein ACO3A4_04515 [Silvanigrellaceae bacterium]